MVTMAWGRSPSHSQRAMFLNHIDDLIHSMTEREDMESPVNGWPLFVLAKVLPHSLVHCLFGSSSEGVVF